MDRGTQRFILADLTVSCAAHAALPRHEQEDSQGDHHEQDQRKEEILFRHARLEALPHLVFKVLKLLDLLVKLDSIRLLLLSQVGKVVTFLTGVVVLVLR